MVLLLDSNSTSGHWPENLQVGTGSARACVIDGKGDIIGLASENIGLWQPEQGYYVRALSQPAHSYTCQEKTDVLCRSNPQMTFGDAFVPPFSVSWTNTTSILALSVVWPLTLPALSPSSLTTRTSPSQLPGLVSTTIAMSYFGSTIDRSKRRPRSMPLDTTYCVTLEVPCQLRWRYPKCFGWRITCPKSFSTVASFTILQTLWRTWLQATRIVATVALYASKVSFQLALMAVSKAGKETFWKRLD